MRLPQNVRIIEVGLRDGLQAEQRFVPTEEKIKLVHALVDAGISHLEASSFVHPGAVPQMADAELVFSGVRRRPGVRYGALVLNRKGAERAIAAGVDEIRFATMISETFSRRNARMSVKDSLDQACQTAARCREAGTGYQVAGVLGTCFGCPYEGSVAPEAVMTAIERLVTHGIPHVTLCDTTGMAHPLQVTQLCEAIGRCWPGLSVGLHFHNTRGMGLANVLAGLQAGVSTFESAVGGAGGCPFAPGANGNVCTEDLVHMLHSMGVQTGVDLKSLVAVAVRLENLLGHQLPGQVMKAGESLTTYSST
ncbi:MAG TPA: hydroxymethylglutaryl-CoA lyase [Symbiobacteriaceae bacterium]|nr:hydroxymethylglutaryl-CoA lyase [Symbiobacteriaceae bacterium]